MKTKTIITGIAILTLLIGFSSGNFLNPVFAEDETSDDDHRDEMKEERKEQRDAMKEEYKEQRDAMKEESKEPRDAMKDEYKEHRDAMKEKMKAHKLEIKSKYKDLKIEFKEKYYDMREELKNHLRDFKQARLAADDGSSDISEDDILAFEEKRLQLQEIKREFREHIRDLTTQVRGDIDTLRQDRMMHDEERRDKIKDKLSDLRLKYKAQIKEHRADFASDAISDSAEGKHVSIGHNSSDDADNAHSIRVSVNAVSAHLRHGDTLGQCEDAVLYDEADDETTDETDTDTTTTGGDDTNDEGQTIEVELKEELGIAQQ